MQLINYLSGKKTYIIAIVGAVLNLAVYLKWITVDQLSTINDILFALGLGALRAGVAKSSPNPPQNV